MDLENGDQVTQGRNVCKILGGGVITPRILGGGK